MTISAKVVADSINEENGVRLVSLQLRFPRYILPQFLTHRVFSRNSSSSRAIPVKKLIQDVLNDPVYPSYWGKNKRGMQAHEELSDLEIDHAKELWEESMEKSIKIADELKEMGAHKQIVNRLLEPFSHINTIVTATEWSNFFKLRIHPDAQPEIRELAEAMYRAIEIHETNNRLSHMQWHLPYLVEEEKELYSLDTLKKISAARCARVSYNKHDGSKPNIKEDLDLFDRLVGGDPKHLSPTEHQAKAMITPAFSANFRGWSQFREEIERSN